MLLLIKSATQTSQLLSARCHKLTGTAFGVALLSSEVDAIGNPRLLSNVMSTLMTSMTIAVCESFWNDKQDLCIKIWRVIVLQRTASMLTQWLINGREKLLEKTDQGGSVNEIQTYFGQLNVCYCVITTGSGEPGFFSDSELSKDILNHEKIECLILNQIDYLISWNNSTDNLSPGHMIQEEWTFDKRGQNTYCYVNVPQRRENLTQNMTGET